MRFMTRILFLLFVCLIAGSQLSAQDNEVQLAKLLKKFPEADINKDGVLTIKEAKAFQRKHQEKNQLPTPTFADVAYGSYDRNVLDLWLADSDEPTPLLIYIHGGGFRGGDKGKVRGSLIEMLNEEGISVASINYRLAEIGLLAGKNRYPVPMHDGARAIQFLRHNTEKYNLDKTRFAAAGASAGGCMLMWLGFHPDLAQPGHEDPVLRESSRLQALAPIGGQSSVHAPNILEWYGLKSLNNSKKEGIEVDPVDGLQLTEEELALGLDASPMTHLTKDDPPIYLVYGGANVTVDEQTPWGVWIHHPIFGIKLKEAMDSLEMECYLQYKGGPAVEQYDSQLDFIIQKLKEK
jgi:acetyl esterase